MNRFRLWLPAAMLTLALAASAGAQSNDHNIILITLDGARTQEMFGGLDADVFRSTVKDGKIEGTPLYRKYWAATPEGRREKLMPFFWGTLMKRHGSIAGNRARGSTVQTANKLWFSYPGYSEILTGEARDDLITSNDKKRNPQTTVLEFLKTKLRLNEKQVAVFASWDTIPFIAAREAGAMTTNGGYEKYEHPDAGVRELSRQQFETPTPWDSVRHDFYTFRFAMAHLKTYEPRVVYLSLGETDDWAHDGRYDRVLETLARTDDYLRQLHEFIQGSKRYRDKTSIVITTDHGRGNSNADWKNHGEKVPESQYGWLAIISPGSPLRGEWEKAETVYLNQVAATLCRFVDVDYGENNPRAGKPVTKVFTKNDQ